MDAECQDWGKKEVKDQVIWETLNWPWFHCEPSKKQECLREWVLTGHQGVRPVSRGGSPSSSSFCSACLLLFSSRGKTRSPLLESKLALWLLWPTECGKDGILVLLSLSLKTSFHFISLGILGLEAFTLRNHLPWTSLSIQGLRCHASNDGVMAFIPSRGPGIPHAIKLQKRKKKESTCHVCQVQATWRSHMEENQNVLELHQRSSQHQHHPREWVMLDIATLSPRRTESKLLSHVAENPAS